MDAVKFFEEAHRYCDMTDCSDCEIKQDGYGCIKMVSKADVEHVVGFIEIWSKERPKKTNADKFLEVFGERTQALSSCSWWEEEYQEPCASYVPYSDVSKIKVEPKLYKGTLDWRTKILTIEPKENKE